MSFTVRDCTLITRMAGVPTAMNLRELQERVSICPEECLFHHFCETVIRPTFDDPEFHNDIALWARRNLRDRVLAERLGIINPYKMENFEQLRTTLVDLLEERLSEVAYIPWAPKGQDFQFMQAATVVFNTGIVLEEPNDLAHRLPNMSLSSVYYHFVEARRRTVDGSDDFSVWLKGFDGKVEPLLRALSGVDFYFMSLQELKQTLIDTVSAIGAG